MNHEHSSLEHALMSHSHSIEGMAPTSNVLQRILASRVRARRRLRWSGGVSLTLVAALFIARWSTWDRPSANVNQTSLVNRQSESSEITAVPERVESPTMAIGAPTSDPFRVYATWRIPILVSRPSADGSITDQWDVLEVRKQLNTNTLDRSELDLIQRQLSLEPTLRQL